MRPLFPAFLVCALCVSAQTPARPPDLVAITPDTVVAVVNGQKFTAGDLERITTDISPQARALATSNPKAFLLQYAHSKTFAAEAEKAALHEKAPYRERLADARNDVLAKALVAEYRANLKPSNEELRKQYDIKRPGLKQARVKVIFISRISQVVTLASGKSEAATPQEIQAKVDSVATAAKQGADFAKLALDNSDDRDTAEKDANLPYPIRASAANIPADIRDAVVSAKPGDIVGPLEHATGYYIFRIEAIEIPSFEEVRSEIETELKNAMIQKWLEDLRAKSTVELQNDGFWQTFLAANRTQPAETKQPEPAGAQIKPETAPAK